MKPTGRPKLIRGDEGGPLSRELTTVKLARLANFLARIGSLAYPRASGLSDFEWRVLARVCETPPLSINELAALLHRGVAQVSRTVKKLVTAGLLHRENRGGGPGVAISPTQIGRAVYAPLVALARESDAAIVTGLEESELRTLDRCLAVMTENALARLALEQALLFEDAEEYEIEKAGSE